MTKYVLPVFLLAAIGLSSIAPAADRYVRAGASGNGSGTDWNNAYPSMPGKLIRGDTYYIADGYYGSYSFDDGESGTSVITILKATETNHGTNTGWSRSYGDGQTNWGPINIKTSYWLFDGQKGYGNGSKESYGFKISYSGSAKAVRLVKLEKNTSYIRIRHVDMQHAGAFGDNGHDIIYALRGHHYAVSYCYLHDCGRTPILLRNNTDSIWEYLWIARNESTPREHSEAVSAFNHAPSTVDRQVFRYCVFEDIVGTGGIIMAGTDWEIYGNIFFWTTDQGTRFGNGAIGGLSHSTMHTGRIKIYNNTFYNLKSALNAGIRLPHNTLGTSVAYNNLWVDCENNVGFGGVAQHDYNTFFNSDNNNQSEPNIQFGTGNPFVDAANHDFRLRIPTANGLRLDPPFDKDRDGNTRGADGAWDRGAFEFTGSGFGNLPPNADAGPDQLVTIGDLVTLDGSNSSDPDGDDLTFLWAQTAGPTIEFSNTNQATTSFVVNEAGVYMFSLIVRDNVMSDVDEITITTRTEAVPDSSLIAYWKVDEGEGTMASDAAGSNHGTIINGPFWRPNGGVLNGGIEFDGENDYIDIGNLDVTGGTGLTIALWVLVHDFGEPEARLVSKAAGVRNEDHYWMASTIDGGTALRFRLKAGGSTTMLKTSQGIVQPGQWCHFAATYDGNAMRIYKDGIEVAETDKTGTVDVNPNVLAAIGNQPASAGIRPFDGLLDEVRIYNRALGPAEIQEIMHTVATGISGEDNLEIPSAFELKQNYPNPFNPSTSIPFYLSSSGRVKLDIYNVLGEHLVTLVEKVMPAGSHSAQWTAIGAASGVYYYRLTLGATAQAKKMILTR